MRGRGLAVPAEQSRGVGVDEVEERPLAVVGRFRDLPTALPAKGSLKSAGIACFLADDNLVRMDWLYSNLVDKANAEEANGLLNGPIPKTREVEGVGQYEQPHCPRCQSLDTTSRNWTSWPTRCCL